MKIFNTILIVIFAVISSSNIATTKQVGENTILLKESDASFTAALRVFMMEYYRTAARTNGQVTQVQRKIQNGN